MNIMSITADFEDMQPDIRPGDVLRVAPSVPITERDIALVMIGDQVLCRKVKRYASGVFLIPGDNRLLPEFHGMEEMEQKGFKIFGKVVECIRRY